MVEYVNDLKNNRDVRDQLGTDPGVFPIIKSWNETLKLQELSTRIKKRDVTGMIWGHPTNGIWGVSKWTNPDDAPFVLESNILGILGTSTLGGAFQPWEVVRVINPFNRFIDYLRNTEFVGTSSTATVSTTSFNITF